MGDVLKLTDMDYGDPKPESVGPHTPLETGAIVLNERQIKLIENIQKIHSECESKNNDFRETYEEAILLMRNKSTPLWYEGVANQMVDIFEYCSEEFFDYFEKPPESDQDEHLRFETRKNQIMDSHEIMQSIKHKRREKISKIFRGEYHKKVNMDIEITDENYEQIFKNHETLLVGFFESYPLKT